MDKENASADWWLLRLA